MYNHCQDFVARNVLIQETDRLGIPGFEKFLLFILTIFSLFWIFHLRHFAPHAIHGDKARTFKIELYRYKSNLVPVLPESFKVPESVKAPELVESDLPAPVAAPDTIQTPIPSEPAPQKERPLLLKAHTQTQLLEKVLDLYRAENPQPIDIPDLDMEKHRPDNVFDPRLADRIAEIRKKNSRRTQGGNSRQTEESYFDNMNVLNYRKGDTCFQIIEIPGVDHHWYAGKCATTDNDMEFELNKKKR